MYDNITLRKLLTNEEKTILSKNSNVLKVIDNEGNITSMKFKSKNDYDLTVNIYGDYLNIHGSLVKYCFKNEVRNFHLYNLYEVKFLIFSDFGIDVSNAEVRKLEIGANLIVANLPKSYFKYISSKKYQKLNPSYTTTLYCGNDSKGIIFYDKTKEAKKSNSNQIIPDFLKKKNLIRIESKFKKADSLLKFTYKKFNKQKLTFSDLQDYQVYYTFIKYWEEEYFSINKTPIEITIRHNSSIKPSDTYNYLIFKGINSLGGLNEVEKLFENQKHLFSNKNSFNRVINVLKEIIANNQNEFTSKGILELDAKVKNEMKKNIALSYI